MRIPLQWRTIILDCDGVLWRGSQPIQGAAEMVTAMQQTRQVLFMTNNSTLKRSDYVIKMKKMGIETTCSNIITSASATAWHLRNTLKLDGPVYVIGEQGLEHEIIEMGFTLMEPSRKHIPSNLQAVVIGMDRSLTYDKLAIGTICLNQSESALFVATNQDAQFPAAGGLLLPGAGAGIAALEVGSGRKVQVCVGKPSIELSTYMTDHFKLDSTTTVMIGDRLNTDIEFGKAAGWHTVLVLTGISSTLDVENLSSPDQAPDHILASLAAFDL